MFSILVAAFVGIIASSLYCVLTPECAGTLFAPLCDWPPFPFIANWQNSQSVDLLQKVVDYPNLVEIQVEVFNALFDGTVSRTHLDVEMKQAEISASDLVILIRSSQIPTSVVLEATLMRLGAYAKFLGGSLQLFDARVGDAADRIIAMNRYTVSAIKSERMSHSSENILKLFSRDIELLHSELLNLISATESFLGQLYHLKTQLRTVRVMTSLENPALEPLPRQPGSIFKGFWWISKNTGRRRQQFDSQLELLNRLSDSTSRVEDHIDGVRGTLKGTVDSLQTLILRAAQSLSNLEHTPAEVHVKTIQNGIDLLGFRRAGGVEVPPKASLSVEGGRSGGGSADTLMEVSS